MHFDKSVSTTQQPSSCLSCHIIGISSASALGIYMFYHAKQAKTTSHRFTCAFFGLGFFIFASHRVSSLFKDIAQKHLASSEGMQRSLEQRR